MRRKRPKISKTESLITLYGNGRPKYLFVDKDREEEIRALHFRTCWRGGKWWPYILGASGSRIYCGEYLLDVPKGTKVFHKNGKPLDCRSVNLSTSSKDVKVKRKPVRKKTVIKSWLELESAQPLKAPSPLGANIKAICLEVVEPAKRAVKSELEISQKKSVDWFDLIDLKDDPYARYRKRFGKEG